MIKSSTSKCSDRAGFVLVLDSKFASETVCNQYGLSGFSGSLCILESFWGYSLNAGRVGVVTYFVTVWDDIENCESISDTHI